MQNFNEVQKLVYSIKSCKNVGYDEHISKVRDYYDKKQTPHVQSLLHHYLPKTASEMLPSVYNIIEKGAELDANSYRVNPTRELLNSDSLNQQFQELLKKWPLETVIHETERRLMACKTIFLRLNWPQSLAQEMGKKAKPEIRILYPDKVHVLEDPRAPDSVQAAKVVIVDISDKRNAKYEVWEREGQKVWFTVFTDKEKATPRTEWVGRCMPFVVFQAGLAQESVYLDRDRDLVNTQDSINVELSDRDWGQKYVGHPMLVHIGGNAKSQKLSVGANVVNPIEHGQDVKAIKLDVTDDALKHIEQKVKMQGIERRQSVDAWSTERNVPLSGISREIANIGSNEKRLEHQKFYRIVETEQLLPLILELSQIYDGFPSVSEPKFSVKYNREKVYEDPTAKTNRVAVMQDKGWISPAVAAVMNGLYNDKEEAVRAGVSDEIEKMIGGTGSMKVTE